MTLIYRRKWQLGLEVDGFIEIVYETFHNNISRDTFHQLLYINGGFDELLSILVIVLILWNVDICIEDKFRDGDESFDPYVDNGVVRPVTRKFYCHVQNLCVEV